jgi:hypothetical protein
MPTFATATTLTHAEMMEQMAQIELANSLGQQPQREPQVRPFHVGDIVSHIPGAPEDWVHDNREKYRITRIDDDGRIDVQGINTSNTWSRLHSQLYMLVKKAKKDILIYSPGAKHAKKDKDFPIF